MVKYQYVWLCSTVTHTGAAYEARRVGLDVAGGDPLRGKVMQGVGRPNRFFMLYLECLKGFVRESDKNLV